MKKEEITLKLGYKKHSYFYPNFPNSLFLFLTDSGKRSTVSSSVSDTTGMGVGDNDATTPGAAGQPLTICGENTIDLSKSGTYL